MKKLISILIVVSLFMGCKKDSASTEESEPFFCNVYGRIYITSSSDYDYSFYAQSSVNANIDMKVAYVSSSQYATSTGRWYLVSSRANADYVLKERTSPTNYDFRIYEASSATYAGDADCE